MLSGDNIFRPKSPKHVVWTTFAKSSKTGCLMFDFSTNFAKWPCKICCLQTTFLVQNRQNMLSGQLLPNSQKHVVWCCLQTTFSPFLHLVGVKLKKLSVFPPPVIEARLSGPNLKFDGENLENRSFRWKAARDEATDRAEDQNFTILQSSYECN